MHSFRNVDNFKLNDVNHDKAIAKRIDSIKARLIALIVISNI